MVLITSCIAVVDRREIDVVDIPGSFLTADMDEIIHMVLFGRIVELMAQVNPSIHRKYVTIGNVHRVLYVQQQKALYRTLWYALRLYQKVLKDMELEGLVLNPYDQCLVKNMVQSDNDNLNILHMD